MAFKLTELYAELSIQGQSQVTDALGGIRREMIKTQRLVSALGGEMTAGLGFAQALAAREIRRGLEPVFRDLQKQTLANLGALKGWNATQMATIQGIGSFISKIGSLEYHVGEFAKQLEGLSRISKYAFFGGTAGILGLGAAASPQAIKTLTDSFHWLAAEVGTAFVPVIAKAAGFVQQLALAFRSLSPQSKEFVAKWVTAGVVLAGTGVAINVLASAFTGLAGVLRGVATAYAWVATSARAAAVAQGVGVAAGTAGAGAGLSLSSLVKGGAAAAGGAAAGSFGAGGMPNTFSLSSLAKGGGAAAAGGAFSKVSKLAPVIGKMGVFALLASEIVDLFGDLFDDLSKNLSLMTPVKTLLRRAVLTASGGPIRRLIAWITGSKTLSDEGILKMYGLGSLNVGAKPGEGMKVSPWGQPWMGRIEDAWRQAQMNATRGLGPEGEILKIQYDSYLQLQQIAANTQKDGVGPQ